MKIPSLALGRGRDLLFKRVMRFGIVAYRTRSTFPAATLLPRMPLSFFSFATVVPLRCAILLRLSPLRTFVVERAVRFLLPPWR